TATVRIDARATQDLSSFNLDTDGHTIDSITVAGRPARWEISPGKSGQELTVTPARPLHDGRAFTAEVRYRGNGKAPRLGLTGWKFGTDGGFASAAQSSRADTFLPCNDTPSDKATWTFHISAPEGYVAAANGELLHKSPRADGSTVWHFALRERMATELIGIAVVKGTYLYGTSHRGLPLRHIVPQGQEDKYGPIVARTADHLAWLEAKFGRYPFSVYGVHIYDGYTDALENQTLSLFSTNWFKPNANGQPGYETTMVHEMAHQWFGDSVTPESWRDMWLNEGFATYAEWLWAADKEGVPVRDSFDAAFEDDANWAFPPADPPGAKDISQAPVYGRGAMVVHELRRTMADDERFFALLRGWTRAHRHG
ncbi:M1 family metallopeptidase, partial [Streptomyces misionensis]|uniref:M1 family metallopeptidase n=1 Tax=Streptomyces misionensis TaxID=67331 RepID=UPI0036BAF137